MPAKPVRIHEHVFRSKTAATIAIRRILYKYNIGEILNSDDTHFLRGVITLHPHASLKIGCGIASFSVEQTEIGTRCFWLTRSDGTRTDFSYVACLTHPTHEHEVKAALRYEVRHQIIAFKERTFSGRCALTGVALTPDKAHVDHIVPFDALTAAFAHTEGVPLSSFEVSLTTDGETYTYLTDRSLAARWQTYHERHAELRVISRAANLGRAR